MESAAIFVIGGLRGLKTASILNVVVEFDGNLEEDINGYVDGENGTLDGEKKEILTALEAIYAYSNKN
ncbi:uridine phosphorylase [Clostridium carboxidivorans P7]|uniref:Uridine phosphorylase n=2 Tax=Clostridium TaxID=1485 RepID=C6PUD1_9CLOT|nr:uridine phosphorylase [Clostridium carboxidivorans P7]